MDDFGQSWTLDKKHSMDMSKWQYCMRAARVPQIQIKSNIGSIWIWSNQIDPDLNLIWFKYLDLNLIWIWIFNSNFQIKSNICQIKSNLAIFEFDQIKYSQIWIWIWSNIWFKYLKIKSNCRTLITITPTMVKLNY